MRKQRSREDRAPASLKRSRRAIGIFVVAATTGFAGYLAGQGLNEGKAAPTNDRPEPSLIGAPVELRPMEATIVIAGQVQVANSSVVALSGQASQDGQMILTRLPTSGGLDEGDSFAELSGRPIVAYQGTVPVYRDMGWGDQGSDVAQLEAALERLGHEPGSVDGIFDDNTSAAVARLYEELGVPLPVTERFAEEIAEAETALAVATSEFQLADQAATDTNAPGALAARQELAEAEAALPVVQSQAARSVDLARRQTELAEQALGFRRTDLGDAAAALSTAEAPGAINPSTGDPYTPTEVSAIRHQRDQAILDVTQAENDLAAAKAAQQSTSEQGALAVQAAQHRVDLARASLGAFNTVNLNQRLSDAGSAVYEAQLIVDKLRTRARATVLASEAVFVSSLPTRFVAAELHLGDVIQPSAQLGRIEGSSSAEIVGRISQADRAQVKEGAVVRVRLRSDPTTVFSATIREIRGSSTEPSDGEPDDAAATNDSVAASEQVDAFVELDDPAALDAILDEQLLLEIVVASSPGEVLSVPVAAVVTTADGAAFVEVIGADSSATSIPVSTGIVAGGFVQIEPQVSGALQPGDMVVVGRDFRALTSEAAP